MRSLGTFPVPETKSFLGVGTIANGEQFSASSNTKNSKVPKILHIQEKEPCKQSDKNFGQLKAQRVKHYKP